MKIVTSGFVYTDIDALACAIAYAEFFGLRSLEVKAILPVEFNNTVSQTVRNWDL